MYLIDLRRIRSKVKESKETDNPVFNRGPEWSIIDVLTSITKELLYLSGISRPYRLDQEKFFGSILQFLSF